MRPLARSAVPLLAALLLTAPAPHGRPASRQGGITLTLVDTAVLAAGRLDESSGVAASHRYPGLLWTHNDSGNDPVLFATDSTGRDRGSYSLGIRSTRDWEDLALAPCVVEPGDCLYAADIGDNRAERRHVVVYRLREPGPPAGAADSGRVAPLLDSIVLRYPDVAHNAEGLAVTAGGQLLIVTKDTDRRPTVFTTPFLRGDSTAVLTLLCSLALRVDPLRGRIVTGAALSPDESLLAVRTYASIHLFRMNPPCSPLLGLGGLVLPVVESQGEGVTFDQPDRLVLTSERGFAGHAILTRLRLEGLPR